MDEPARRRPRTGPPGPTGPPPAAPAAEPDRAPGRGRSAFVVVAWGALAVVAVVIAVAFATGTADDLPWGAIIGVVAVALFALAAGRRRAALRAGQDDEP